MRLAYERAMPFSALSLPGHLSSSGVHSGGYVAYQLGRKPTVGVKNVPFSAMRSMVLSSSSKPWMSCSQPKRTESYAPEMEL